MNDVKQNANMKRKENVLKNLKIKRNKLNTTTLKNQKKRGSDVRKMNQKRKVKRTVRKAQMTRKTSLRKVNVDRAKWHEALKKKKKATKILLGKFKTTLTKQRETLENKEKKHESQVGSADSISSSSQDSNSGSATGNMDMTIDKCLNADCGECSVCKNLFRNGCNIKRIKDPTEKERMDGEIAPNNILRLEALLIFAARLGDFETIAALHSVGVSVQTENTRQRYWDNFGFYVTPLHIAAAHGHATCVEMLIQLGANVNAQANFGSTPLHMAVQKGHLPCVKLLLKAGADCNLHTYCGSGNADFPSFTTALHLAAIMDRPECVEHLIKHGANLEAVDINGHTSLYIAARSGFSQCVLRHLEHALPSDFISTPCLETSDTPLHFAVENGMLYCVQKLVQLGADVNHLNNRGYSPLHMLFADPTRKRRDVMPMLKVLVLESRHLDMKNALHKNMFLNDWYLEAITFLIAYGASLSAMNKLYNFSLFKFIFSRNGTLDLLSCFLDCSPVVPLLSSLKAPGSRLFSLPEDMILQGSIPTTFIPVKVVRHENCAYALIIITPQSLSRALHGLPDANPQNKFGEKKLLIPLRQPHLDRLYEIVSNEVRALNALEGTDFTPDAALREQTLSTRDDFHELQLQLFYEKAATCPRSLQQCCRYAIRQCFKSAPAHLKHVRKLPLPEILKSYLLFGCYNPNSV